MWLGIQTYISTTEKINSYFARRTYGLKFLTFKRKEKQSLKTLWKIKLILLILIHIPKRKEEMQLMLFLFLIFGLPIQMGFNYNFLYFPPLFSFSHNVFTLLLFYICFSFKFLLAWRKITRTWILAVFIRVQVILLSHFCKLFSQ